MTTATQPPGPSLSIIPVPYPQSGKPEEVAKWARYVSDVLATITQRPTILETVGLRPNAVTRHTAVQNIGGNTVVEVSAATRTMSAIQYTAKGNSQLIGISVKANTDQGGFTVERFSNNSTATVMAANNIGLSPFASGTTNGFFALTFWDESCTFTGTVIYSFKARNTQFFSGATQTRNISMVSLWGCEVKR